MFTRCPACRTVFHITAAELRAADGTVVCGACDTKFDALDSLSETLPEDAPEDEADDAQSDEEDALIAAEDARDEEEFLEELEALIGDDGTPEEPLPERFRPFQPPAGPPAEPPAEPPQQPGKPAAPDVPGPAPDDWRDDELDDEIPDPDSVFRVDVPADELDASASDAAAAEVDLSVEESPQDQALPGAAEDAAAAPAAAASAPEGPDRVTRHASSSDGDDSDDLPGFAEDTRRSGRLLRVVVLLAAVLFVAGTWAHVQRGKLLRHPTGEAILGSVYSVLRMDVAPDWSPGEFRILRSEAIATPDQPGHLRVAIEYLNAAGFAQPLPVVRIVLLDRFGQRLGSHDFAPERYLENYAQGARLPGGGRIQASLAVPDPGGRADGFRVDLCLELDTRGLVCAAEPFR